MKYVMIVLIALILSACGKAHVDMPEEVQPFYNQYFEVVDSGKKNSGTITIEDIDIFQRGVCNGHLLGNWEIKLNKLHWDRMNDDQKRNLVFHELTHCTFDSHAHSSDPNSYMYADYRADIPLDQLYAQTADYVKSLE